MLTLLNVLFLIILVIPVYFFVKLFTKQKIPKGLKELPKADGLPLLGLLVSSSENRFMTLHRLKDKLGPIFKFNMGFREIVVLNNSQIMQKTLKEMGTVFSGRWQNTTTRTLNHDSGITQKDKEWWAIQRSFVLKVLRDFGLGKQRSTEIVNHESAILLKEIEETCGTVVSARNLFPKFMVNVISKLVMNIRFERTDANFQSLTRIIEKIIQTLNVPLMLTLMFPILERFPLAVRFLLWCSGLMEETEEGSRYIKEIIADHEKRFSPENEGEDLIDIFLKEKHRLDRNKEKDHTFTDWQLIRIVIELFAAGYETTSTTLSWSMILLAKHQEIQETVYREILDVVGSSRTPSINDKKSLTYTQAVMDEIFRVSSVVPLSLTHRVLESVNVDGFFIPKDSIIFPNLYSVHHDKSTWEKPMEFYPEHFLTEIDGVRKYSARDELMPFSVGKRQCLGESLARLEFFTFLTGIIQRFRIRFPKEMTDEEFRKITVGTGGTIRAPLNTDIIFELRQN